LILLRKRKDKKKVIFQRYIELFFGRKNLFGPLLRSKRFHNTFIYSVKFISLLKPLIATTKNYLKYENFISDPFCRTLSRIGGLCTACKCSSEKVWCRASALFIG
jgi:hypothetical protein